MRRVTRRVLYTRESHIGTLTWVWILILSFIVRSCSTVRCRSFHLNLSFESVLAIYWPFSLCFSLVYAFSTEPRRRQWGKPACSTYYNPISAISIPKYFDKIIPTSIFMFIYISVYFSYFLTRATDSDIIVSLLSPLERQLVMNLLWLESAISAHTMNAWVIREGRKYIWCNEILSFG